MTAKAGGPDLAPVGSRRNPGTAAAIIAAALVIVAGIAFAGGLPGTTPGATPSGSPSLLARDSPALPTPPAASTPGLPTPTPTVAFPAGTVPPGSTAAWVSLDVEPVVLGPVRLENFVTWAGGYLAIAQPDDTLPPAAWLSRDGRSWARLPTNVFGLDTWTLERPVLVLTGSACAIGLAVVTQDVDGHAMIWSSLDGRSWKASAWRGSDTPWTIATNGRTDVLATQQGQLFTSSDCSTWTSSAFSGFTNGASVQALAQFRGGYAAGGFLGSGTGAGAPDGRPVAWWSSDGMSWQAAAVSPRPGDGFFYMQAGARGLVALTDTKGIVPGLDTLWTSPDGRRWTAGARDPLGLQPSGEGGGSPNGDFVGDGSRLIVFGSTDPTDPSVRGQLWTSFDGSRWSRVAIGGAAAAAVTAHDGPAVTLLRDGVLFSSPSGTWVGSATPVE